MIINITYKVKFSRELPVVKLVAMRGEQGPSGGAIDVVKRNGVTLPISNKEVDVIVPTKTSDLTNDVPFLTGLDVTGGVASGNSKLVTGGQVYSAIQTTVNNATNTTGGVAQNATNLVTGGQVYSAIQTAISSIADGDSESY